MLIDILAAATDAAPKVEFENTNWLGQAKKYSRFPVPHGGHMFKFGAGANLDDIVRAVNQVGAAPSDA